MLEADILPHPATSYVQPVPHRSIVGIAAFRGQDAAINTALGTSLPTTPCRSSQDGVTYLWSGPRAWLAMSEDPALLAEISERLRGIAAVTEQSDGLVLLRVIGPQARKILAKLVPIDLHPSAFSADAVAITLAGHIGIRIWQDDDGAFTLACFRSFAGALHHSLLEASHEFNG